MKSAGIVVWLSIVILLSSCTHKGVKDEAEILSLIYNTQIGHEEHFGAAPPIPPLPPDFDEINRYESTETARQGLKEKEWIEYFDEEATYASRVREWQERMLALDRIIIFDTRTEISDHQREYLTRELSTNNYDWDFPETFQRWDIADIKNLGKYEIVDLAELGEVKLDTTHVGVLQFSEIGFNETRDSAILYYDWHCGGLCGGGYVTILYKEGGRWKILKNLNLWVA
ncbi:MAG: hypothetical protein IPL46_16885 [Saprospiraceae bacterium]|nr:hypothetical protein [Saprospiraceae bacterium]